VKAKYGLMVPITRLLDSVRHLGKGPFPYADTGVSSRSRADSRGDRRGHQRSALSRSAGSRTQLSKAERPNGCWAERLDWLRRLSVRADCGCATPTDLPTDGLILASESADAAPIPPARTCRLVYLRLFGITRCSHKVHFVSSEFTVCPRSGSQSPTESNRHLRR